MVRTSSERQCGHPRAEESLIVRRFFSRLAFRDSSQEISCASKGFLRIFCIHMYGGRRPAGCVLTVLVFLIGSVSIAQPSTTGSDLPSDHHDASTQTFPTLRD